MGEPQPQFPTFQIPTFQIPTFLDPPHSKPRYHTTSYAYSGLLNGDAVVIWDIQAGQVPRGMDPLFVIHQMAQAVDDLGFVLKPSRSVGVATVAASGVHNGTTARLQSDSRVYIGNFYIPGLVEADLRYQVLCSFIQGLHPKISEIGLVVLVSADPRIRPELEALQSAGYKVCIWCPEAYREATIGLPWDHWATWESILQLERRVLPNIVPSMYDPSMSTSRMAFPERVVSGEPRCGCGCIIL